MPLSPYLSFAGNCADAIAYYQRTLGAELLYKISFGEMPKSAQDSAENCPSGMQFPDTAIAHANVRIAGSDIMMSDAMPLSPYLSFAGNCSDAIAYYQRTLGAELLYKISFGEMPKSAQDSAENCPSGMQFPDTAIAHANVRIAGSDIMMSDAMPSGKASYSGFTLVLDSQQVEEGKRWFDNLAANGKIEMAWQETFWAHGFGKVTDKFGVPWMINVVKQQPTQ